MIKPSRKWLVLLASTGIFAVGLGGGLKNSRAEEVVYDKADVSISMALDNYITYYGDVPEISTAVAATEEADTEASATDAQVAAEGELVRNSGCRYPQFEGKALVIIKDNVNIRAEASAESEKVGTIGPAGIMLVLEQGDEWSRIASGNCEGYIKNEFIAFGDAAGDYAEANLNRCATVNATSLNVRTGASEDSECITLIPNGESYTVLGEENGWTNIEIYEGMSGYVKSEFVDIDFMTVRAVTVEEEAARIAAEEEDDTEAPTETETPTTEAPAAPTTESVTPADSTAPVSGTAQDLVNYALQFVGNPYVYGGSSLTNGTDCSGFTMRVYEHFGYSLPRSSRTQANAGTEVSLSALLPGDLLFYTNGGSTIQHVALYIGNGQIVHASTSSTGIIVSSAFRSTPCKAVRIIN